MNEPLNIILAVLIYTGVLAATIKLFWRNIEERILTNTVKRIELKYNLKLESYKNSLEKKNYISKTRFDAEFKIYRELSETFTNMYSDSIELFLSGTKYLEETQTWEDYCLAIYNKAVSSYSKANIYLKQNGPFISEKMYDVFFQFMLDCNKQIEWYPRFMIDDGKEVLIRELNDEWVACIERTKTIQQDHIKIIAELREYLKSIDVIEND